MRNFSSCVEKTLIVEYYKFRDEIFSIKFLYELFGKDNVSIEGESYGAYVVIKYMDETLRLYKDHILVKTNLTYKVMKEDEFHEKYRHC